MQLSQPGEGSCRAGAAPHDARLFCPSVQSQSVCPNLGLATVLHLFGMSLKGDLSPFFLPIGLEWQCDLENVLLAAMETEDPSQVSCSVGLQGPHDKHSSLR